MISVPCRQIGHVHRSIEKDEKGHRLMKRGQGARQKERELLQLTTLGLARLIALLGRV